MSKMDEIYTKIQVFLIRKDRECEKLRFLTSRTTPSNAAHVSEICETIKTILQDSTSSITGESSIKHFKFLLLNTNFKAQEHLCEDIANGHLVRMCPPLSPFLFMEILWALKYDDIICNSILYMPLDLCSEILEILRRCLDLDFQRAFNVVIKVIANCYRKIVSMNHRNTQVLEEEESLKRFMGSIQELLSLLSGLQSKKTEGLSQLLKYERSGWTLIQLLNTIKDCIVTRRAGNVPSIGNEESEKLYRLTFGRNFMVKLDPDIVTEAIDFFSKELLDLLLVNVKTIDCYVYMGWAELDYAEDTSMSMQRAVGLACYHFVEYLGADQQAEEYRHVIECLRQLSSKPDAPFSMSLKELCSEIDKGNKECLRKLIQRFEEWDSTAMLCFDKNQSFIDKGECLSLLNSAVKFFEIHSEGELCGEVYGTVMKILLGQKLVDMIEIVVEFILIHNASRALESINFEPDLKNYINQGIALCSNKTSLRIILFFTIQNPQKVLNTLIKVVIGYPEYTNSMMSSEDICKLSSIMQIRDSNNFSLLSNMLKGICTENIPWNGKKFIDLTHALLNKNLLSADELLNNIFIPALRNVIILPNIQHIITCIRTIKNDLTPKMRKEELLCVLALQMAHLRKNTEISIYSKEEVLNLLIRIIQYFSNELINSPIDNNAADLLMQKLEADLDPLDKIYFAQQWGWIRNEVCIDQVLQDYKRRCFYIINESKSVKNCRADFDEFLEAYGLKPGDFLQHLILRCTEFEYLRFAKEALIIHWNYFGWEDEVDAYAQLCLATVKACSNYLESILMDQINSWEFAIRKFASLIKSLAKLTTWFINVEVMNDYESVHKSLATAMNALNLSTNVSPDLLHFYQEFKTSLSQSIGTIYSYEIVAELIRDVDKFGDQCLSQCGHPVANTNPKSQSALQFYLSSTFISICSNWPIDDNSLLLSKIDKKLYSKSQDGVGQILLSNREKCEF